MYHLRDILILLCQKPPWHHQKNTTTITQKLQMHPQIATRLTFSFRHMISEAITSLKDRHGSSQPAIAKFVERKYRELLPPNFKKLLSIQLKKFVKSEKLTKVKNSYKISAPEKVVVKSARKIQPEATATRRAAAKKSNARGHGPSTNKRRANEKALKKMKRLSQVETPEALEKNSRGLVTTVKGSITGAKMKRLRQVKTPETLKKKNAASIPAKKIKLLPTPCLQNHQTLLGPIAKKTRK
ncbi:histone H1-like isoform X2 [Coffea eugenioides]|uniref:histone H1-like isoform X2 n=1 Tax=Coffea eugenioides TaxID=49369 RepID=UPI000F60B64E|nr:histone H1-like isoform X2 [Coffea eugenioides]